MENDFFSNIGKTVIIKEIGCSKIGKYTKLAIRLDFQTGWQRYASLWIPKSQIISAEIRKCLDSDAVDRNNQLIEIELSKWFMKQNEPFFKFIEKAERDSDLDEQYGGRDWLDF